MFAASPLPPGHTEGKNCPACARLEAEIAQLRLRITHKEAIYLNMGILLPASPRQRVRL
jgi:hypothetical protein